MLLGYFAHGCGVVAESLDDFSVGVEVAAVHRCDEDGCCAVGSGFGDVLEEVGFEVCGRRNVPGALLLIIVAELNHEVVAGTDGGHDFGKAMLADEALDGFAGLGFVGDGDAGVEEERKHLAPGCPGFLVLIDDGGVSGEIDRGDILDRLDDDGTHAGMIAVELKCELFVPVERADLAGFEADLGKRCGWSGGVGGEDGCGADVDVEDDGVGFARGDRLFIEEEAAGFGAYGVGGRGGTAEGKRDAVVAVGDGDGKEEGFVAAAGAGGEA